VRRVNLEAMASSKQIAEYVALSRLGYPATLVPGAVVVDDTTCIEPRAPDHACEVLERGDTIVSVDGVETPTVDELAPILEGKQPGDTVEVELRPIGSDELETRTVELIASPEDPDRTIIGFLPADTRTVELPFEVDIDTDRIGGPSAGLAFTLTLLDELTPGSLTGGVKVAATGTIAADGTVGAIGALRQKAIAVRDAGATVFLVPAGQRAEEIEDARAAVGDAVEIIPVADLDEALRALARLGGNALELGTPGAST
jgi:PDZ domain-containing protein